MSGSLMVNAEQPSTAMKEPWWVRAAGIDLLELPTDFPLPSRYTYHAGSHDFRWRSEYAAEVVVHARGLEVSSAALILSVAQTWLSHYAKQKDLLLGFQEAGRDAAMTFLGNRIGWFDTFQELVQDNQLRLEELRQHPLAPGELSAHLNLCRDDGHPGLCPVVVQFGDVGEAQSQIDEIPRYLTLNFCLAQGGLDGSIQYSKDLFDPISVGRMEKQLEHVLAILLAESATHPGNMCIIPNEEKQLLMGDWQDTDRDYDRDLPLHRRFEAVVRAYPNLPAVIFEGMQINYRELNERANRLARHLIACGTSLDQPVGVYMARCIEAVVAYVAILKAGGVYLPMDASFPSDRLALILEESGAGVIMTHNAQLDTLPPSSAYVLNLDVDIDQIERYEASDLELEVPITVGSFIIYTSGSTGKPKGVFTTHQALVNFIISMQHRIPLQFDDRFLYKTSCCFDPALMETTWPLLYGAAIVVAKPEGHKDNAYLIRLIQATGVTLGFTVPSALLPFFEEPGAEKCTSLRNYFTGGEAVPMAVAERFYELYDGNLHNIYGPAETTVMICFGNCRTKGIRTVPFGRPISNTKLYVLGEDMQPCPIGISGEIYIAGESLGRGYIKRAHQTAERFLPDPFSSRPGARMYKTGDIVRYRSNAELEFMGRNDAQIKIRGFRIELGEIESAIQRHPHVKAGVVVVHETEATGKVLVAHMVLADDMTNKGAIRAYLKQTLPEYMVPTHFILHESLPRTPTGKLDRSKLPAPNQERPELDEPYVAPGTAMEQTVADIWSETLNMDGIGIHDNFLDLGGHSLSAVKIIASLRTRLDIELSLVSLLESPTIALLAHAILEMQGPQD